MMSDNTYRKIHAWSLDIESETASPSAAIDFLTVQLSPEGYENLHPADRKYFRASQFFSKDRLPVVTFDWYISDYARAFGKYELHCEKVEAFYEDDNFMQIAPENNIGMFEGARVTVVGVGNSRNGGKDLAVSKVVLSDGEKSVSIPLDRRVSYTAT